MNTEIALSALLCSRLCHDLISPVGAFSNGIEILADEEDPTMRQEVFKLLGQSVQQAGARLMFFRMAFGAGGGFGDNSPADSVRDTLSAYFAGGKIAIDWKVSQGELDRDTVKIVLNLALLAADALPRGGGITVEAMRAAGGLDIAVVAQGDRLLDKPEIAKILADGCSIADLDSKTAPAYLVHQLVAAQGGAVKAIGDGHQAVTYRVRL